MTPSIVPQAHAVDAAIRNAVTTASGQRRFCESIFPAQAYGIRMHDEALRNGSTGAQARVIGEQARNDELLRLLESEVSA